jgi:hypothetical protein
MPLTIEPLGLTSANAVMASAKSHGRWYNAARTAPLYWSGKISAAADELLPRKRLPMQ